MNYIQSLCVIVSKVPKINIDKLKFKKNKKFLTVLFQFEIQFKRKTFDRNQFLYFFYNLLYLWFVFRTLKLSIFKCFYVFVYLVIGLGDDFVHCQYHLVVHIYNYCCRLCWLEFCQFCTMSIPKLKRNEKKYCQSSYLLVSQH